MYAEYWNPMNWNSRIESMNGNTVVENSAPRKSCVGPGRNAALPDAAILSAVTPPVYFGRFVSKVDLLVDASPKMNMAMKHATPEARERRDNSVKRPRGQDDDRHRSRAARRVTRGTRVTP